MEIQTGTDKKTVETAHGLGEIAVDYPEVASCYNDNRDNGVLNEYIEKAYEEFLDSQRHLEKSIRREETRAEQECRNKEQKLLERFKTSFDQAAKVHEKTISQSIRAYESALRSAAQAFISSKEEAERQYLDALKEESRELKRLLEEARLTRNADIDACHRRIKRH